MKTILYAACLLLHGCASTDDKIKDMAGGVFIVFLISLAAQSILPKVTAHPYYLRLKSKISLVLKPTAFLINLIGVFFVTKGLFSDGIDQINILIGFVLLFSAHFLKKHINLSKENVTDPRFIKLTFHCFTFLIALFFLLYLGKNYLKL